MGEDGLKGEVGEKVRHLISSASTFCVIAVALRSSATSYILFLS